MLTTDVAGANAWWWGTSKMIDGWVALPVLAATLLFFVQWPAGRKNGFPA
jgi:hypothetical protein